MWSFKGFWDLVRGGAKGYPFLAFSKVRTPFQAKRGLSPVVYVIFETERGCQRITLSQGEFAARYRL